jgi:Flp pilus assembly protein TadD
LTGSDGECYGFSKLMAGRGRHSAAREMLGWRAELARGARMLREGNSDAERACFARALAMAPEQAEPALALGREEWKLGRLVEAESLLRLAWRARRGWTLAGAALSRVLIERGAGDEARAVLAEAMAASRRSPALLLVLGELELSENRTEEAADAFAEARAAGAPSRAVDAGLSRAENARGVALTASGKSTEAAFAFKRAADLDSSWAPPHVNLGALFQQLGRKRSAREHYRRALELDPRNGIAHFNLGLLARTDGELAAAQRAFRDALLADPPHPHARRELALVHAERGDHTRAVELLEEELRVTRLRDASVYANLGLAYALKGERESAEGALRQALSIDRRHAHALTNLAALCASDGRYVEAAMLLRRARESNADRSSPPRKECASSGTMAEADESELEPVDSGRESNRVDAAPSSNASGPGRTGGSCSGRSGLAAQFEHSSSTPSGNSGDPTASE